MEQVKQAAAQCSQQWGREACAQLLMLVVSCRCVQVVVVDLMWLQQRNTRLGPFDVMVQQQLIAQADVCVAALPVVHIWHPEVV